MYFGLEAREPFLDVNVVRTALSLPPEWKQTTDGRPEKAVLREAFTDWLPDELLWRSKEQFGDGSGAGAVLAALARNNAAAASAADTQGATRQPPDSWPLRSDEEILYYRIWQHYFSGVRPNSTLGRFATP
jgi:asparagine synthase (glutamine-hydrolysing)